MERDGMKRGSATNHLNRSDTVKVMMIVLPSSAVKLIHLGNQLDFSVSSVSSAVVMESIEFAGTSSQSMKTVSSSCTWLLRETVRPLHQEDWKKEHGNRFIQSTKEHFENPIMLDLVEISELTGADCEGKQVEKALVGRASEFENGEEKEDLEDDDGV
jgi:hypothetical protein